MSKSSKKIGLSIAFLGPDGSGKSTIIEGLTKQNLPLNENAYFHLKPIVKHKGQSDITVENPHLEKPYSTLKSYGKLIYFVFLYNWGWFRNVIPLKKRNTLIIFDRYYDDMMADPKRYRYGGHKIALRWARKCIPKPDIYFVLTAEAKVIYGRKQEVPFEELQRQIKDYRNLVDNVKYLDININRKPEEIILEVSRVVTEKYNEHHRVLVG